MPQLVATSKRNEKKGLVVVGVHVQSATEEEVLKSVKQLKIKFPVVDGGSAPASAASSGIPHSYVFNSAGDLIFDGHPSSKEFERAVREATKDTKATADEKSSGLSTKPKAAASGPLVAERTWTNSDGKTMAAALVSVDGTTGNFRRKNGTTFTYAIDKLSESDQELIRKAAEPATEEN